MFSQPQDVCLGYTHANQCLDGSGTLYYVPWCLNQLESIYFPVTMLKGSVLATEKIPQPPKLCINASEPFYPFSVVRVMPERCWNIVSLELMLVISH